MFFFVGRIQFFKILFQPPKTLTVIIIPAHTSHQTFMHVQNFQINLMQGDFFCFFFLFFDFEFFFRIMSPSCFAHIRRGASSESTCSHLLFSFLFCLRFFPKHASQSDSKTPRSPEPMRGDSADIHSQ